MTERLNLKNVDLDGLAHALAPLKPTRTAVLKLFAGVFAHGAPTLAALKGVPQVSAKVRDWVQAHRTAHAL